MFSRFGGAIIFHIICFFYIICTCVRQRLTWHCKARAGKKLRAIFLRRRPRRRDKRQTCARRRPLQSRRRCVGARVGMCAVYRPRAPTKKHYPLEENGVHGSHGRRPCSCQMPGSNGCCGDADHPCPRNRHNLYFSLW